MYISEILTLKKFINYKPFEGIDEIYEDFRNISEDFIEMKGEIPGEHFIYIKGTKRNKALIVIHPDTIQNEYGMCERWDPEDHNPIVDFKNGSMRQGGHQSLSLGAEGRSGVSMAFLLKDLGHSILLTGAGCNFFPFTTQCSHSLANDEEYADVFKDINANHEFILDFTANDLKTYKVINGNPKFSEYLKRSLPGYKTQPAGDMAESNIEPLCTTLPGVSLPGGFIHANSFDEEIDVKSWIESFLTYKRMLVAVIPAMTQPIKAETAVEELKNSYDTGKVAKTI